MCFPSRRHNLEAGKLTQKDEEDEPDQDEEDGPDLGEVGFRPKTVIDAMDHIRSFVGRDLKSIAQEIDIKPLSGKFKGMQINQWEKLNLWKDEVESEKRLWDEGGQSLTGKRNPPNLASKTKNWGGDVVQGIFGYPANSSKKKDLGFLELKTFGVLKKDGDWTLPEKFLPLSSFNWQNVNDERFSESKIQQKIMQQLWVPIIKSASGLGKNATVEGMGSFVIGSPMIWIPTEEEALAMAEDYERVRLLVRGGRHDRVRAGEFSHRNKFIVPNTAGRDSSDLTSYSSEFEGIQTNVKRRKWYLKREVVMEVFLLHE